MVQHRFLFVPPSDRELLFFKRWRYAGAFAWLFPIGVLSLLADLYSPAFWALRVISILSLFLQWRRSDIERREAQARFGFIEITPTELRIGLSFKEAYNHFWRDYQGYSVRHDKLRIRFLQDRVLRLSELETPDDLIDALRAQTPSR